MSASSSSMMRNSSLEANTFLQKICYFIDILKDLPVRVAKKKKMLQHCLCGATFQLVVASVKLRITNFHHTITISTVLLPAAS